jgi:hypothetical protein
MCRLGGRGDPKNIRARTGLLKMRKIRKTDCNREYIIICKQRYRRYLFCQRINNLFVQECGITGRKYTYGDLLRKSKNLGKALRKKLNLQEGDVIALLLPNVPEFPIAVLGALEAGLVVTTLNPVYTSGKSEGNCYLLCPKFREVWQKKTNKIICLI